MTVFILNSPILTSYGTYRYSKISLERAKNLLYTEGFQSAIGHKSTADFLTQLLGIKIPVNRIRIIMQPGDKAIVFRILQRLPEGAVLSKEELKKIPYELGLLEREE